MNNNQRQLNRVLYKYISCNLPYVIGSPPYRIKSHYNLFKLLVGRRVRIVEYEGGFISDGILEEVDACLDSYKFTLKCITNCKSEVVHTYG